MGAKLRIGRKKKKSIFNKYHFLRIILNTLNICFLLLFNVVDVKRTFNNAWISSKYII